MRIAIIVALQLFVLFSSSFIRGYVFPDDFKICRASDPNINDCLVEAIQDATVKLADPGIHSPINLTIQKMYYPYFVITPSDSDRNTTIECFNLTYPDLWRIQVEDVSVNLCNPALVFTTYSAEISAFIPRYRILGRINQEGKRESMEDGGVAIIRYYNVTIKHSLKFKRVDKDNEKYLDIASYNIKLRLSKTKIFFGDLVEDNVALEDDLIDAMDQYDLTLEGNQRKRFEIFGGLMFRWYAGRLINSEPMDRIITGWSESCSNISTGMDRVSR